MSDVLYKLDADGNRVPMDDEEVARYRADAAEATTKQVVILYKVDFYRRMTDAEAEQVEATIGQQPIKQRRIFESANSFRSDAEEWATLQGLAVALFGAARAAELLAASE